jgi:hypothetical protein
MQSRLTVHETDPHDIFVIEPDVVLAARPDAARPDAVRTDAIRADTVRTDTVRTDTVRTDSASADPVHEALSRLAHQRADIQPKFSAAAPSPTVDTTFRAAAIDGSKPKSARSGFGRLVRNTFVGFLFALVSAMAAALWTHHGNAAKQMLADYWPPAKQMIAGWLPPFVLAASSPTEPPPVAGAGRCRCGLVAIGAIDGARHRHDGSADRAAQRDHRATEGQPGADRARCCQIIRSRPAASGCNTAAAAGRGGGTSSTSAGTKAKAGLSGLPARTRRGFDLAATIAHSRRPAAAVTARAIAICAATASHDRTGRRAGSAAATAAALIAA